MPEDLANQQVSHYRVLRRLGAGGMGVVWEAEDLTLGRHVALKFLPDRLARDPHALERLTLEARAASALNHPNICTIYEIGEADVRDRDGRNDHVHFISMELLEGQSLDSVLMRRTLELDELLELAVQIADALDAAHAKGIVHRDIKPGNIFLTNSGRAKVLDFGLAKRENATFAAASAETFAGTDPRLTSPGTAVGTVAYMSPEQARGKELDARSDVFSLGAVLYEMATRRLPFEGETTAVMFEAILNRDPAPVLELNPAVPPKLDEVIRTALEKDRDLRYQSAGEIRAELKRLKRDTSSGRQKPGASGVVTAASGSVAAAKPRRVGMVLAAIAAVVLLVAAGLGYWYWENRPLSLEKMSASHLTTDGLATVVAASPDGRYVAYARRDGEKQGLTVRQIATGSDLTLVPPELSVIYGITFSPDGNYVYFTRSDRTSFAFSYLYKVPALGGAPQEIIRDVDGPVSFAPDGKQFAFVRGVPQDRNLKLLIGDEDGKERLLATINCAPSRPSLYGAAWSPNGKTIVLTTMSGGTHNRYTLWQVDARSGKFKPVYEQDRPIGRPAWLSNGYSVLAAMVGPEQEWRWQIWQIPLSGAAPTRLTNDVLIYSACCVEITRDKSLLAAIDQSSTADLWLVPGGNSTQARQLTSNEHTFWAVWMPDGNILRPGSQGVEVVKPDGSSATPVQIPKPAPNNFVACGDKYFVYDAAASDPSKRDIWRMAPDGSSPTPLTTDGQWQVPECSPDGRTVYVLKRGSVPGSLWALPIEGGVPHQVADNVTTTASVSPDGKQLIFHRQSPPPGPSMVVVLDIATGKELRSINLPPGANGPTWSPDSRSLQMGMVRNNTGNVWEIPVTGGEPRQVTHFTEPLWVSNVAWSRDGKNLLMIRGRNKSDVLLMRSSTN